MHCRRRAEEEDPEVQMAPMLDCVFLLLIFFLVTASLKKPQKELPIELPAGRAAIKARSHKNEVVISVDRNGKVYVANRPDVSDYMRKEEIYKKMDVTTDQLHKMFRALAANYPNARIRIDCDRLAYMGQVAQIMDMCQQYHLNAVGIRTKD